MVLKDWFVRPWSYQGYVELALGDPFLYFEAPLKTFETKYKGLLQYNSLPVAMKYIILSFPGFKIVHLLHLEVLEKTWVDSWIPEVKQVGECLSQKSSLVTVLKLLFKIFVKAFFRKILKIV